MWIGAAAALPLAAACSRSETPEAAATAQVVDSVVPREVALARFRTGLDSVDTLAGGQPSREALVRAFARAVAAQDTAALERMTLSRQEFAWLYYPANPQGLPPYDLSPDLMWFMLTERGRQGLQHLLAELGGRDLRYTGHSCDPVASHEGANTVYGPCLVRWVRAPGDTVSGRLFGLVIERHGRFKFVSYANRID